MIHLPHGPRHQLRVEARQVSHLHLGRGGPCEVSRRGQPIRHLLVELVRDIASEGHHGV